MPRMAWTGAANIALAVMLLVAAFGAWRVYDDSFGGRGNTPGEGRYALAPLVATPEATPAPSNAISACDFSRSVPIYSGVDSPQADGAVLYITSSGDLTLACPEESEPIVLSHNVVMASATPVPGVVQIQMPNGNTTDVVMMNVITGEWIQLNPATFSSYLGDMNGGRTLQVSTVVDSPTEWSLINLETMRSATLSELTGAKFPASHSITVATALNGKGVAVAFSEYKSEGSSTLARSYGAQGDVAVISNDLETVHWVTVPADFPMVTNLSLSPDASKLAIVSDLTTFDDPTPNTMISIIDVTSDEEIARTDLFTAPGSAFLQWAEDGNAMVYATANTVYRLEFAAGATPTELYVSDGTLMLMPATTQPNLVRVDETISENESNLIILTTDSDDVVKVEGKPWFRGTTPVMHWTEELAPILVKPNDPAGMTQIVDPVTGQPMMDAIDAPPLSTPSPEQQTWWPQELVTTATDAPVSIVDPGNGDLMVIDLAGESPSSHPIPTTPGDGSGRLRLSPDGTTLIAGQGTWEGEDGPWWSLDLTNPDAEWVPGPEGSKVTWLVPTP